MDKILSYQIFTKVSELESFTKTADVMNLPKASISQYVAALEEQVGAQLLHRTTRQVKLTKDGEMFLQKVQDFLTYHDEIESFFSLSKMKISGKIRVDMPIGFSKGVLLPLLSDFLAKYPDVELEISSTDRYVDVIGEGFDCVVRVGNLSDSGLVARRTGELKILNCASPAYLKKYGTPKKVQDLEKHFIVEYKANFNGRDFGFEYFDKNEKTYKTLKMKHKLVVNNSEAYTQAALNGFGIIQAPDIGMGPLIKQGLLLEVLPNHSAEPMPVHILYPNKKNLPARVRVFMDWLVEVLVQYK